MPDMNIEENRLRTFQNWPSEAPIDSERLARAGFFATGIYMETQCNWCHKKISNWQFGDQAMIRHRQLDPLCSFVLDPNSSGNVPLTSSSSLSETPTDATALDDLRNENSRLDTFKNWPNPNISPQSLAKAGFYYLNEGDHVRCAWCFGVIGRWEKGDNAFEEHKKFFPNCARVQLGPLIEIASDGIRELGIQQIKAPRKLKFSSLDARLRTYIRWPRSDIQKPEVLAQAGFYYQDIEDQVRCFHCSGGLRSWQKEDDPWFEHAKWFPTCQFVQLVKGPTYVYQVSESKRASSRGDTSENGQTTRTSDSVQHVMPLDEAMLTDPVQSALQMGLNEGRIRNATKRHLEMFGKPYDTAEELVEAVLEGQADEEDDDDQSEQSSSIVREVSRILNNIFNPRNSSIDNELLDENITPTDENESSSPNATTSPREYMRRNNFVIPEEYPINTNNEPNPNTVPDRNNHDTAAVAVVDVGEDSSAGLSSLSLAPGTSTSTIEFKQQLSLEEENRKLKDARLCKVCMDDEVGVVFLPCGHLVTCVQCAPGVNMCPLCRSSIKGFVRTFLS